MLADTAPPAAPPSETARVVPMMAKLLRKLFWMMMPRRFLRSVNRRDSTHPIPVRTRQLTSTKTITLRWMSWSEESV